MEALSSTVREVWGCDLRPHQEEALRAVLQGRDVLVTVATGGGKSLIYQSLSFVMPPVLVISPLISLIQDQVQSAREKGMRVCNLCDSRMDSTSQLVYSTPEKAVRYLADCEWGAIAVDEAHCVVTWGSGFRPEYGQLSAMRPNGSKGTRVPILALTASATPKMVDQIAESIGMVHPKRVCGSFARGNLTFRVLPKKHVQRSDTKFADVQSLVRPPCIVYATSRKECDELSSALSMFKSAPYHAQMDAEDRAHIVDMFMRDEIRVVCATIAFGMGIDKPDVRSVIHYGPSRSVEAYYQEAGRAGRDGMESTCTMLIGNGDWPRLRHAEADVSSLRSVEEYSRGDVCYHQFLLRYFGEESSPCGKCGVCTGCVPAPASVSDSHTEAAVGMVSAYPVFGMTSIASALRGDKAANPKLRAREEFGAWKGLSNKSIHASLKSLVRQGVLVEKTRRLSSGGEYVSLAVP